MKDGITLIAEERQRQISEAGYTPEHDDAHSKSEIVSAAKAYIEAALIQGYSPHLTKTEIEDQVSLFYYPADWGKFYLKEPNRCHQFTHMTITGQLRNAGRLPLPISRDGESLNTDGMNFSCGTHEGNLTTSERSREMTNELKDISTEIRRTYHFPCGSIVTIEGPVSLVVSDNGHRIVDQKNNGHYVPLGWVHLMWENKPGATPMVA